MGIRKSWGSRLWLKGKGRCVKMADVYMADGDLLRDYGKLSQEYKNKAGRFIKNLLRLQRAEKGIEGKLCPLKKTARERGGGDVCCSFCGKPKDEAFRLIVAGYGNGAVFICDECTRLCGEIIDEEESAEGNSHEN